MKMKLKHIREKIVRNRRGVAGLIAIVGIVLIFMVPITFYYLGTLAGVDFSAFSTNLVTMGIYLFVFFIALLALFSYLNRRR